MNSIKKAVHDAETDFGIMLVSLNLSKNYPSRIFSTIAEVEQSSRKSSDFTSPP